MDENASWKVFSKDTEAGRLLSRLYGQVPSKQTVNYPKLRRRPNQAEPSPPPQQWKTTGRVHSVNRLEAEERERERKHNTERATSLRVPKVARRGSSLTINGRDFNDRVNLQGCMPRRKTEQSCKDTLTKYDFANKR